MKNRSLLCIVSLAMAALVSLGTIKPAQACYEWTDTTTGITHYYEVVKSCVSWDTALDKAATYNKSLGLTGYLATVTSAAENAFIDSIIGKTDVWLGGSDEKNEGTWKWMAGPEKGQTISYTNWTNGEPNNSGWLTGEDYLMMYASTGKWNDTSCSDKNYYVVEYNTKAQPVPVPAALPLLGTALAALGITLRRKNR